MIFTYFIKIIIITLFLSSCSEEKNKSNNYKKQSDLPSTGKSFNKKGNMGNKVGDFY